MKHVIWEKLRNLRAHCVIGKRERPLPREGQGGGATSSMVEDDGERLREKPRHAPRLRVASAPILAAPTLTLPRSAGEGTGAVLLVVFLLITPVPTLAADAELTVVRIKALPAQPADAAWGNLAPSRVPLIPQDMVEPRQLTPTTPEVFVRALTDGDRVAFLLEWADATTDDVNKPATFTDACAVQLPSGVAPDVPAPQMGEPGRRVEITYWRAAWQATADGRPDSIQAIYPGASIDHYPFEAPPLEKDAAAQQAMAKRYAPAQAAGNDMGGARRRAVEDLIAEGPGTLAPAEEQVSAGSGTRTQTGWTVVLVRPLPKQLANGKRAQVAFAVWDGARGEVGARKMRSAWVPVAVEGKQ